MDLKGIGALYIKNGINIDPVILGGGQEHGLSSGTENVASIVGFGKACEIAKNNLNENILNEKTSEITLVEKVLNEIPEVTLMVILNLDYLIMHILHFLVLMVKIL